MSYLQNSVPQHILAASNPMRQTSITSKRFMTSNIQQQHLGIQNREYNTKTPLIEKNVEKVTDGKETAIKMLEDFFYGASHNDYVNKSEESNTNTSNTCGVVSSNPQHSAISTTSQHQLMNNTSNVVEYFRSSTIATSSSPSTPTSSSMSLLNLNTNANTNIPPLDVIDPNDRHIWRSKYCVLEDGALYFYRNDKDANLPEAKAERRENSLFAMNKSNNSANKNTSPKFNRMASSDSLSMSPIPRPIFGLQSNSTGSFNGLLTSVTQQKEDSNASNSSGINNNVENVIWEKRVALDCVGSARSAEDEYGENSFILLTPPDDNLTGAQQELQQDCLILKANSTIEMQEWLFQFHRSLASLVREVVNNLDFQHLVPPERHYPLQFPVHNNNNNNNDGTSSFYHQPASMLAQTLSQSQQQHQTASGARLPLPTRSYSPTPAYLTNNKNTNSGAIDLSQGVLSHGHGRNDMHRTRIREKGMASSVASISSSYDNFDADDATSSIAAGDWEMEEENNDSNEPFQLSPLPGYEVAANILAAGNNNNNNKSAAISPSSPLLRNSHNQTQSSNNNNNSNSSISKPIIKKYIPPHLRGGRKPPPLPIPVAPPTPEPIESNNSTSCDKYKSDDNGSVLDTPEKEPQHFKLGGCADLTIGPGSIMDPPYKKRSVKLGKGCIDKYGYTKKTTEPVRGKNEKTAAATTGTSSGKRNSLSWEVGAVSACGVRQSNEDSYVIANNLSKAIHPQNDDSLLQESSYQEKGLFAIFDGHCGYQTARYAAENLSRYLLQAQQVMGEKEEDNSSCSHEKKDDFESSLRSAIMSLDEHFCKICVTEGREWGDSGATALITVLNTHDDTLYVANLGDSRGILCASFNPSIISDPTDTLFSQKDGWNLSMDEEENPNEDFYYQRSYWKEITDTHSPSNVDEKERIEKANGWITTEQEVCIGQLKRLDLEDKDALDILRRWFSHRFDREDDSINNNEESLLSSSSEHQRRSAAPGKLLKISRVCGELAVSRALGDRDFKSAYGFPPTHDIPSPIDDDDNDGSEKEGTKKMWWQGPNYLPYSRSHNGCFCGDLVSADPDIQTLEIGREGVQDEFLLLACDGLWDVMDPDDAVRIAQNLMYEKGWSAEDSVSINQCILCLNYFIVFYFS